MKKKFSESVKNMSNPRKIKGKSLKRQASKAIFWCMFLLLFVTSLIGLNFYVYSYLRSYKHELGGLANYTLAQFEEGYIEGLIYETKELYESIPEDVKKDPFSDEYRAYIFTHANEAYSKARKKLITCRESTDITNIYIGFYDKENERLVIALDGDIDDYYYFMGQYISNQNGWLEDWETIEKSLFSNWRMNLEYSSLVGLSATGYFPIMDAGREIIGVVAIDTTIGHFFDELLLYSMLVIPALLIAFGILSGVFSRSIEQKIINPVQNLAKAARSYTSRDKVNDSENTRYFGSVSIDSSAEFQELRDTMAEMEGDIYESMQKIRRVSAEKERMAAEMDIAAEIQRSALPAAFPKRPEFDMYATMSPAKEVAGDFYDFFMLDDDHLVMIIADVSGKGVPAALFMMKGKELLKNLAVKGGKPSEILEEAGNVLLQGNETSMFITIWLGILEISTGVLVASNAGHEFPFIMGEDGVYKMYKDPHGLVCGAMEGATYKDYTLTLPKGSSIFVYTDGVTEALNSKEEYYGLNGIEKCLNANASASAKELVEAMKKDIDAFAGDCEQYDDITMMCLIMNQ